MLVPGVAEEGVEFGPDHGVDGAFDLGAQRLPEGRFDGGARPSFPADSTSASRVVVKLSVGRTPFVVCDDKAIKESCFTTLSQREG